MAAEQESNNPIYPRIFDNKRVFAGGEFTIKLVVSYNGDTSSRSTKVLVNPSTYTFKPYTNVTMAY
jgi:hypothetical protein